MAHLSGQRQEHSLHQSALFPLESMCQRTVKADILLNIILHNVMPCPKIMAEILLCKTISHGLRLLEKNIMRYNMYVQWYMPMSEHNETVLV